MKKKLVVLIALFLSVLPLNVKAGNSDSYVSWALDMGVVAHQVRGGIEHMTNLALMKVNDKTAYCIQPGVEGDNNTWYSSTTNVKDTPLGDIDTKRLSLIGYYGYGYGNHNTKEYYMATQELIWRLMGVENVWWTDKKYNGNVLNVEIEKAEILKLVNNYEVVPRLNFNKKYMIGDTITKNDFNNVLEGYEVSSSTSNVSIEGNKLSVEIVENTRFTLRRKKNGASPIYYYKNGYQTIGTFEYAYDFEKEYVIESGYGTYRVEKYDYNTSSKTPFALGATLKGAVYGLYDINDNLIETKETNENGTVIFENIEAKGYKVKEISPSKGYLLSNMAYTIFFNSSNFDEVYEDYEKIIENEITITKFYEYDDKLLPEENIEFEIYRSDGTLYNKYITDKDGIIKVTLPYGIYTLYQTTTKEGYDIAQKRIINVIEKNEKQEITLVNKRIPVKIEEPKVEEPKEDIVIEEKNDEIKELPNTGKKMSFMPFLLMQALVMLILKNEKKVN